MHVYMGEGGKIIWGQRTYGAVRGGNRLARTYRGGGEQGDEIPGRKSLANVAHDHSRYAMRERTDRLARHARIHSRVSTDRSPLLRLGR